MTFFSDNANFRGRRTKVYDNSTDENVNFGGSVL